MAGCEVMKVVAEGDAVRPGTNLMGKNLAECKMMASKNVPTLQKVGE